MDAKHVLTSKVIWFQFIMVMLAMLNPQTKEIIEKYPESFTLVWAIGNVVLRFFTKKPIRLHRQRPMFIKD